MHIIAGTDFSTNSERALEYAGLLATSLDAELTIVNAFNLPTLSPDGNPSVIDASLMIESQEFTLQKMKKELTGFYDKLNIECRVAQGGPSDILAELADKYEDSIIVEGKSGASGLENKLFGSTLQAVIKNTNHPVFIISDNNFLKIGKKILIAYDGKTEVSYTILQFLERFINLLKAEVEVITVKTNENDFISKLTLPNVSIKNNQISNTNPELVIKNTITEGGFDLLITFSKTHSWFDYLLNGSFTEHSTDILNIPILTIPLNKV
jgi:nucleotide-binding universal stress UspA family protein